MASATNRLYLVFRDNWGLAAKVAICVAAAVVDPSGAAVAAIRAAINAITNNKGTSASIGISASVADTASDGAYEDVEDKATFVFADANNQAHTFRVPAPKETIFDEEGAFVDPLDPAVVVYTGAVMTNCVSKGGAALVTFLGGHRIRNL